MEHPTGPPLVIARGGASAEAPEHTIAAFEAALDEGADALSLRVRLSRDGHPVAFGPATLERTTDGRGTVGECTVRELKRLDAGGWKGLSFRGQRVQTLQEVLERFRDRTRFWIELPDGADAQSSRNVSSRRSRSTRPWSAAWCNRPIRERSAACAHSILPSPSGRCGARDRSRR